MIIINYDGLVSNTLKFISPNVPYVLVNFKVYQYQELQAKFVRINTPDQFLFYDRLTGKIYQVNPKCKQICEYVSSERLTSDVSDTIYKYNFNNNIWVPVPNIDKIGIVKTFDPTMSSPQDFYVKTYINPIVLNPRLLQFIYNGNPTGSDGVKISISPKDTIDTITFTDIKNFKSVSVTIIVPITSTLPNIKLIVIGIRSTPLFFYLIRVGTTTINNVGEFVQYYLNIDIPIPILENIDKISFQLLLTSNISPIISLNTLSSLVFQFMKKI